MSLGGVLDGLDAAIDAALAVPLACYTPREVLEFECGLQTSRARFDALCLSSAQAGHALLAGMGGNHRNIANAVAANTNTDPKAIVADHRLAQWVAKYPLFDEASKAGVLTVRHLRALRQADNKRTRHHLPDGPGVSDRSRRRVFVAGVRASPPLLGVGR